MKTVKHSIALVITGGGGRVLMVLRPTDDESLPGLWGLPAITTVPGEDEDQAVRRAGREKLGVEVLPGTLQGEAETDRSDYALRMRNREATIVRGAPGTPQPHEGTQYVDWRWADPIELKPAARAGSLCCQLLLRAREVPW
ncbi:MAG TPA: NUDIX domain-containing protein [Thermoleophilaceae bacterium]